MKKVLVVDDEKLIVKGLKFSLEQDDMEVDVAYDGGEAFEKIKNNSYDIVLLDIMIPVYTGIEVCQMVREFSNVPIIMLTAKGEDMDKIMGLEYGADDYITKPFNILEVKARIKAILRRSGKKAEPVKPVNIMEINGMKVELDSRRVFVHGKELNLTAKEFDLLELLMAHPNFLILYGEVHIREMPVPWMSMFEDSEKRSKITRENRYISIRNGASAIILKADICDEKRQK